MLDQKRLNLIKSVLIAGVSLIPIMLFFIYFLWPIEEMQIQKWIETSGCFDYIDEKWVDKNTCSVPQGGEFIYITLGVIPFLIFIASMNYFEKKRMKTWRSYR